MLTIEMPKPMQLAMVSAEPTSPGGQQAPEARSCLNATPFRRWGNAVPSTRAPMEKPSALPRSCWNQPEAIFIPTG
ncbi:hypothetical protein D3C83_34760 [compost metagenome]